ncbi:uncharacterized protein LOC131218108 [Magnolia sinica]|uniref:uncharacterized protein LOC131218108 n=1 Tax=Magnolia sinica TaxID=86752 RepID=UPI0026591539|nr:uncharacterized protein LOC131218108 [Magnolia sinica]
MKIFSKILASQLASILPSIISEEQGAFVKGRSIVENISIAREMTHKLDRKVFGGNMIVKLDMENAYDRVEWSFLAQLLQKFGFEQRWISKLSGVERVLGRGIRNLFTSGACHPFKLPQHCPLLAHLFLAHDAILFMNGKLKTVRALLRFIAAYEQASGQKVNFSKSSFILPKKASLAKAHKIRDVTDFKQASFPCTYLGVPLMKGKIRSAPLLPLIHKILGRIEGWKARILNPAARMSLRDSPVPMSSREDTLAWDLTASGNFSVSSA